MSRVTMVILCGILVPALAVPTDTGSTQRSDKAIDCSECHTCEQPSAVHPCLKPICARHGAMDDLDADMGPHVVILDELEHLYVAVRFDHLAHAQMVGFSGGCETCHHYTPPNTEHPACKDCHPKEILHEDVAQPGLKGAYHRNCMGCHAEWDVDTACEICHEKRGDGRTAVDVTAVHRHYEPIELEELIIFETAYKEGDQIPFHHRNHSELYERDCAECHTHQSCQRCHVHGEPLHPMGEPGETDLRKTCFNCHREEKCGDCHGRDPDDLFDHASTGWPLERYHADLRCRSCHGQRGAFMKLEPKCENCHREGWETPTFSHHVTGVVLDEIHLEADCGDCHTDGHRKRATCDACHDDGRMYNRTVGFGG